MRQHLKHHQLVLVESLFAFERYHHRVFSRSNGQTVDADGQIFELAFLIVLVLHVDGQGRRGVCWTLHLIYIPICLEILHVAVASICPYSLYLLIIPKWERVVVAVRQNDGVSFVL